MIDQLPGEGKVLLSANSVDTSQEIMYLTEYLNSITPTSLPPHILYLKEGVCINYALRNLDPTNGM